MAQPDIAFNVLKIPNIAPGATTSIKPKIRKDFVETWIFNDINKYAIHYLMFITQIKLSLYVINSTIFIEFLKHKFCMLLI